mmetsp:Transcript_145154/g.253209  ORF Transcript_145154/g.253209 Transcript_145154/m.253209 type:complete len:156 (-) Transcript_145154:201-668(-)
MLHLFSLSRPQKETQWSGSTAPDGIPVGSQVRCLTVLPSEYGRGIFCTREKMHKIEQTFGCIVAQGCSKGMNIGMRRDGGQHPGVLQLPRDMLRSLGESTLVSWLVRSLQNWRMVAHGGLAASLPTLVNSEEEEVVNVLVGVQHAPPYSVNRTAN